VEAYHFLDEFRGKQSFVVLTKSAEFSGPKFLEFVFVFDKPRQSAGQIQRPGHLASGPKPRKRVFERIFHFAMKIRDHFLRLEKTMPKVGFALGDDGQSASSLSFSHVHTSLVKFYQNFEHGIFVSDVQAAFVILQAVDYMGNCVRQPFFVRLEEESGMIPQL
jgi:hypothetical protein